MTKLSYESLQKRCNVLNKRIKDLEKINNDMFKMLHVSQIRIQQLEAERACMSSWMYEEQNDGHC